MHCLQTLQTLCYAYRALVKYWSTEPPVGVTVDGQCKWQGGDVASSSQTPQDYDGREDRLDGGKEVGRLAVIRCHKHVVELLNVNIIARLQQQNSYTTITTRYEHFVYTL